MDEDPLRRKDILNIILIGSIVMLAILDAFVLFYSLREGAMYQGIPFAAFSALPAFFIFLYLLSRRGLHTLASYLLVGAYLISNDYAAYQWGLRVQVVLIAYALIIVIATILRGTKFGFLVTGLIAAFIIPLWYAQIHGIIGVHDQYPTADDAVIFSILYLLIMVVAWLYNREIERSLRRAQASEQALAQERDLLEIKVVERTDELRRTQLEKVQQLNRLAELGQLSSGLFHDILNLLNALSLRSNDEGDPSLANAFGIAQQIEGFTRAVRKQIRNANARESFSLVQGVEHAIQLIGYQARKEHVRIVFNLDHTARNDVTHFDAPFKFQEIIINLLLNAIESYETIPAADRRVPTIVITLKERSGMVVLRVRDNGSGMAPDIRARIFEPFFTTKSGEKGIGIGLATIKKIIEDDMSGSIIVESEPRQGSLFTVTFPLCHEKPSNPDNDRSRDTAREETAIP